jgi:HSP20 family molecular chaperone IbpA
MTDHQEVVSRKSTEVQQTPSERESELVIRPTADIFEDAENIVLTMDMPGVSKDRLNVSADHGNLIVEGSAWINMAEGMSALYAEVRSTRYRRSFALSGELEIDKIDANLKDGVLTLRIPKPAALRPRKIDVKTG